MGNVDTVEEPERTQSASRSASRPPEAAGARPGCVTAYAVLLGLVATSAAIVGLTTEFDFANLFWLGMAILFGMAARSLWQMTNWARVLVILVHGFGILLCAVALLAVIAAGNVSDGWEPISIITTSAALSAWIIYWFATHGKMFKGVTQLAHLSESFAPRTFADGAAFIVPAGRGWRCSACGGFVRQDARSCKTCHKPFQQSSLGSFLEGAQIHLGAISLVSASFVSIPLKNLIVLRGLDNDPLLTTHKIELKMGPEIVFPSACAWCRSSSVVQQREVQLRQEVKMQDASVGKQVAGLLLGQISLGAGAMVSISGKTQNAVVNLELTLPACQEHAATPELPNLHIRDFDPKRELCLLDLGDADYAAAFCRQNALSDPNSHRIEV